LKPSYVGVNRVASFFERRTRWRRILAFGRRCVIYGKKQRSAPALLGGIALIGISYFMLNSAVWMSVAGAGIVAGVYYWSRRGEE
jgi:hypothetical protein